MKSGTVLRNISIVRWQDKNTVVLKSESGVAPWRLDLMTDESRLALEALRDAPPPDRTFSGEVFVALKGGENRKLGAIEVGVFRDFNEAAARSALQNMMSATVPELDRSGRELAGEAQKRLEKYSLAWSSIVEMAKAAKIKTVTNSEGKFTIKPDWVGPFVVVVVGSRLGGGSTEKYLWIVKSADMKDPKNLILGNNNLIDVPSF